MGTDGELSPSCSVVGRGRSRSKVGDGVERRLGFEVATTMMAPML